MITTDDRQRLRAACGVEQEEPKKELQNVKRIEANTYRNRTRGIKINNHCIYVSREAANPLGGPGASVYLWTAEYDGASVLLMRPAKHKLTQNYKLSKL